MMIDLGGNKAILRHRLDRLTGLLDTLPAEARVARGLAERLVADLRSRLRPLVPRVGVRERDRLIERVDDWSRLCAGLLALRDAAEARRRAEDAIAAKCRALHDPDTAGWFARRCEIRKAFFADVGLDANDPDALDACRSRLERLARVQDEERRRIELLAEAQQRLASIRAARRTAPVAEGLEALTRELRQPGREPGPEWAGRLESLLEPLRRFETRERPPALDELRGLLHRIEDWLPVLDRGDEDGRHAAMEDRLRQLTKDAWAYIDDWASHEDDRARPMLEEAQRLERDLVNRAQDLRDGLVERLAIGRAIFHQFADSAQAPGLGETLNRLIAETPDTPKKLRVWRDSAYRALDDFEAAMGGYRPRIEDRHAALAAQASELLEGISALVMDGPDRIRLRELRNGVRDLTGPPATGLSTTELIASLNGLQGRVEQAQALDRSTRENLRSLSTESEHISQRIRRLERLAGALDEPVAEGMACLMASADASPADLNALRTGVEDRRERAAGVERDLLGRCWAALEGRLAHLAEIQAVLDSDLVPGPLPTTADGRGLDGAEALLSRLPDARLAFEAALGVQLERLRGRREVLLADPSRGGAHPGSAGEELTQGLGRLRDWREDPRETPLTRARGLAHRVIQVERQLARIDGRRRDLAERRGRLAGRLATLQHEFFEIEPHRPLLDRISALIQEVPGVVAADHQAAEQIALADRWLDALERHAADCAGAQMREHLETLSRSSPADAAALLAELGEDRRRRPGFELRDRARRLARPHLDG